MKKVGIISRHAISNYGSFFQAYALERTVREMGYDSYTINYIRNKEKSVNLVKIDIANSKWNKNFITRLIFYAINIPNRYIQYNRFSKFRKKELNLTKEINDSTSINKDLGFDIYCTGSDQVWNETIENKLDYAYFFDNVDKNEKIISYAASFGKSVFDKKKLDVVKNKLKKYNYISVREDAGVDILKSMGYDANQVLDPTLLLNGEIWRSVIGNSYKSCNKKYILIYQVHKNNELVDYAKELAKKNNFDVINISVSFLNKKKDVKLEWLPSYKKVLWLFDNAQCIVTDSFHATAFSINFNKNFVTFLPKESTSRNKSVLKLFGLEERCITDKNDFETPMKCIDYVSVNKILDKERKKSYKWLEDTLREVSSNEDSKN